MTRERKTHLATLVVLLLALTLAIVQNSRWQAARPASSEPSGPPDTIYAMLDAARSGNVSKYLARYTGPMLASLQASLRDTTEAAFSKYLLDSSRAVKGIALGEPQLSGAREASVRVEFVYQDRNEVQIMRLEKENGEWRISSVDGQERVKTLVPYGTPVR
jgi:hypothetical protein